MDCHNRPSHTFQLPERAIDSEMADGAISADLPFAKKKGLELLKASYPTQQQAADAISQAFERYYQTSYPAVYAQKRAEIQRSALALVHIYGRNVFPKMDVKWGSYPNNLGHTDFPGCFRCHDGNHVAKNGDSIPQDCTTCHSLLAMEESNPKVLSELGVVDVAPPPTAPQSDPK